MESSPFLKDAKDLYYRSDYIKALEVTEENTNFVQGNEMLDGRNGIHGAKVHIRVGFSRMFFKNSYGFRVYGKFTLQDGAELYYKKSRNKAKDCLFPLRQPEFEDFASEFSSQIEELEHIIETSETRIAVSKIRVGEQKGREPNEHDETKNSRFDSVVNGLRSYWMGLDVEIKRNFMKVITADLKANVKITDGKALEQILTYARKHRKWKLYIDMPYLFEKIL